MLFNINFERFVAMKFAEIRRLPKWIAFVMSVIKPFEIWYSSFLAERIKNVRRRLCDGSVTALTMLIKKEFDVVIEFIDSAESNEKFIGTKAENDVSRLLLGMKTEVPLLTGTMNETLAFDYLVKIPLSTSNETAERIRAVLNIYNSAGYNFKIVKQ